MSIPDFICSRFWLEHYFLFFRRIDANRLVCVCVRWSMLLTWAGMALNRIKTNSRENESLQKAEKATNTNMLGVKCEDFGLRNNRKTVKTNKHSKMKWIHVDDNNTYTHTHTHTPLALWIESINLTFVSVWICVCVYSGLKFSFVQSIFSAFDRNETSEPTKKETILYLRCR